MAHSPEKKAKAVSDVLAGGTYEDVAEKHKVAKSTLAKWVTEIGTKSEHSEKPAKSTDARRERFNAALEKFLESTLVMLQAWADTCSDPDFITENPSGAHELGKTVLDRADRLVRIVSDGDDE
jgi:hypothetical protein